VHPFDKKLDAEELRARRLAVARAERRIIQFLESSLASLSWERFWTTQIAMGVVVRKAGGVQDREDRLTAITAELRGL
jgi:hypothetical protein